MRGLILLVGCMVLLVASLFLPKMPLVIEVLMYPVLTIITFLIGTKWVLEVFPKNNKDK